MADHLLTGLKLLADATRLNILGILAQQPRSVDELAAMLDLSPSTVSHHLTRLHKAGLVAAKAEQYYHIYALNTGALERLAALLTQENLALRVQNGEMVNEAAYTQQILARWIKQDRLQGLPGQVKHRQVVLHWLVEKFERDKRYDWDQVGSLLAEWCNWQDDPHALDLTSIYSALIEDQLLARLSDGSWHWRTGSPLTRSTGFNPEQLPIAETPSLNQYTVVRAAVRARDPQGVYANLEERAVATDPWRELLKLTLRIKLGKYHTEAEIDEIIRRHSAEDPATVRAALLKEGLLKQSDDGIYWREPIRNPMPTKAS